MKSVSLPTRSQEGSSSSRADPHSLLCSRKTQDQVITVLRLPGIARVGKTKRSHQVVVRCPLSLQDAGLVRSNSTDYFVAVDETFQMSGLHL